MGLNTKLSFEKDKGLVKVYNLLSDRRIWECHKGTLKTLKIFDLSQLDKDDVNPAFKRFYIPSSVSHSFNVKDLYSFEIACVGRLSVGLH